MAGRAAILRLMPVSQREESGRSRDALFWESPKEHNAVTRVGPPDLWKRFLRGGYPELVAEPDRDIPLWHSSYVQTYLERDVRSLRQIGDLISFQNFLRALAARSGQLLNLAGLARDLGVAVNTAKAWLSVLEATFQVIVLRPYHANVGKRLVKTPKVYFTDTGTLCYLAGLKDPDHAAAGAGRRHSGNRRSFGNRKGVRQPGEESRSTLAYFGWSRGRSDCRNRGQIDSHRSEAFRYASPSYGKRNSGLSGRPWRKGGTRVCDSSRNGAATPGSEDRGVAIH